MGIKIFLKVLNSTFHITGFVLSMMLITDLLNASTEGKVFKHLRKGISGYIFAGFLGLIPGCFGSFFAVSLFIHGEISIGALTTTMIATSGDESFIMLSLFPFKAIFLFIFLFIIGIGIGMLTDYFSKKINYKYCVGCSHVYHSGEKSIDISLKTLKESIFNISFSRFLLFILLFTFLYHSFFRKGELEIWFLRGILILSILIIFFVSEHYLNEHIFNHILKKHLLRLFVFTLLALFISEILSDNIVIKEYLETNVPLMIFLSAVIGIIPESGPNLIFVFLYSKGVLPFSVLLTSSIVQDGHGMLPLISSSIKDTFFIKIINFVTGLIVGYSLFYLGF